MSLVTEAELQAKAKAPRVTLDQINALMATATVCFERPEGTTSTFAHVYIGTFYLASGHSACISVENYDQEIGERIARGNAIKKATDQLWQLEGYALYKLMNPAPTTFVERIELELNVLIERHGKLEAFTESPMYAELPLEDRELLVEQLVIMVAYREVLEKRLARSKANA
jgi:hypothetical protein